MTIAVFIQKRDFLGARLMHLPLLHGLRKTFPGAVLVVYSPVTSGGFFRNTGLVDAERVYRYGPWSLLMELRRLAPELVLSLRPLSQWLTLVIGLSGAARRLGYQTRFSRLFLTHTVIRDLTKYRALAFLDLLLPLGVSTGSADVFHDLADRGDSSGEMEKPYFVFIPAGADPRKQWGMERFLELSRRLRRGTPGSGEVFILGPGEKPAHAALTALPADPRRRIMMKETLPRLARVMADAEAVVAQDCAPGHIAQMLETPFVGLFRNRDGRVKERLKEWFYRRDGAEALTCDPGRGIEEITVEEVEAAVERVRKADVKTFPPLYTLE